MKTYLSFTAVLIAFSAAAQLPKSNNPTQEISTRRAQTVKLQNGELNAPIYVLNKKIITAEDVKQIIVDDIEAINVLKDSASTAPYVQAGQWRPVIEIVLKKPKFKEAEKKENK